MIKLFSINHENDIHHLIEIDDEYVISDDEFIRLEFNFDWINHTLTCVDCKEFKGSLVNMNSAYRWYMQSENEIFLLDSSEFAKDNHLKNSFNNKISDHFTGVRLKIKKVDLTYLKINEIRLKQESDERYEQCAELRNVISLLKKQQ
jgi:hypothetical protein